MLMYNIHFTPVLLLHNWIKCVIISRVYQINFINCSKNSKLVRSNELFGTQTNTQD